MNTIKRHPRTLLTNNITYKFGFAYRPTKKMIITSEKNKRIIIDSELILAAIERKYSIDLIKILIKNKDLNEVHYNGTFLHSAIDNNHDPETIRLLITKENVNIKNRIGNTPLHISLYRGYASQIIELLITEKNLESVNNAGNTPLHTSLNSHRSENTVMKLIVKENLSLKNVEGLTPYHIAAIGDYSEELLNILKND